MRWKYVTCSLCVARDCCYGLASSLRRNVEFGLSNSGLSNTVKDWRLPKLDYILNDEMNMTLWRQEVKVMPRKGSICVSS